MRIFARNIDFKQILRINKYVKFVENYDITDHILLIEFTKGDKHFKNSLVLLEKIQNACINTEIYVVFHEHVNRKITKELTKDKYNHCYVLKKDSKKYYKMLAVAKTIICDSSMPDLFIKRIEQRYIKLVSKDFELFHSQLEDLKHQKLRTIQKDCLKADYFICDDKETLSKLRSSEFLIHICKGKISDQTNDLLLLLEKPMESNVQWVDFIYNHKKNLIFYLSALEKNGITTSFLNLMSNIDLHEYNYFVCFKPANEDLDFTRLDILPNQLHLISMDKPQFTIKETFIRILYFNKNIKLKYKKGILDKLYQRECNKLFNQIRMDYLIHFTGYESDMIRLIEQARAKRIIYVHNDMVEEIKLKKYQHYDTLHQAYQNYDKVAVVTKDILEHTIEIGGEEGKYCIVNNCHDYVGVQNKAKLPLIFDDETKSTHTLKEIEAILNGNDKKFISIGRFSPEKGHFMLMDAFVEFQKEHPHSYLFIIGGYGPLYDKTVSRGVLYNNIVIIKSIKNPMPILKRCDLFILSSLYEGLGLVLLEAVTLNIPIVCTDITGPREFVKAHDGLLVMPDKDGILNGMKQYMLGGINRLKVDFDVYNRTCVKQYRGLVEK